MLKHGETFEHLLSMQSLPHHAVNPGAAAPEWMECIIEMPEDCPVKIELSKASGLPRIDRPQKYSSRNPFPYGLFPQTHCGKRVAKLCMDFTGHKKMIGDGDPLDLCVLTSINMPWAVALQMRVRPIGGFPMIDNNEADDKIIAVLEGDLVFGRYTDISDVPSEVLDKMEHYFTNYKRPPGDKSGRVVKIKGHYGREHAHKVILASMADYQTEYGTPTSRLLQMRDLLAKSLTTPSPKQAARRRTGKRASKPNC